MVSSLMKNSMALSSIPRASQSIKYEDIPIAFSHFEAFVVSLESSKYQYFRSAWDRSSRMAVSFVGNNISDSFAKLDFLPTPRNRIKRVDICHCLITHTSKHVYPSTLKYKLSRVSLPRHPSFFSYSRTIKLRA